MKKYFILWAGILCISGGTAFAQRQNTYFLKNNGQFVTQLDSADYIRIVKEPDSGSLLYPTREYYKSGKNKSMGFSSSIVPARYEGQYISFYENGKRKEIATYHQGKLTDTAYTYFPNGAIFTEIGYHQLKDSMAVYIKTVKDTAGNEMVTNGNGMAVFYDRDFKYITSKGGIKNGLYDGEWTGEMNGSDRLIYKEQFSNGKLISGESRDAQGNIYHYTLSEVQPTYKGGIKAFYNYLASHVVYPSYLYTQGIQGIVQVQFTIMGDGSITNIHALNQVHPDLAREAIRVIKASKGWQPGSLKGRNVNVYFNIPVSFKLRS